MSDELPGIENRMAVHTVAVFEERWTKSTSGALRKELVDTERRLTCRAIEMRGDEAFKYAQMGWKKPWLFLFYVDPALTIKHVLRYTGPDAATHSVYVKSVRNAAERDVYWAVYGDELTQETISGK